MKYDFLKYLSKSELIELENIILGKSNNEELLSLINTLTKKNIDIKGNFSNSYIPHYNPNLEEKCIEILKKLTLNDFIFFVVSITEQGNYSKEKYNYKVFPYELLIKMKDYNIDGSLFKRKVDMPYHWKYPFNDCDASSITFDKIDNMFKDINFIEKYHATYNMLNYIKNYIYSLLKENPNITREDLFLDIIEKKQLVRVQLRDISSYLLEIRNNNNLRICISNLALSRNANKTTQNLTPQQETFIECLAFGTTLDKIKNRDYEDYKKLLYLPQERV